jgi:hypothetical protein
MLGDEYRMAAKRRLLSVVARRGESQPVSDELVGMTEDPGQNLVGQVLSLAARSAKLRRKRDRPSAAKRSSRSRISANPRRCCRAH